MGRYSVYRTDELPPRVHKLLQRYKGLIDYEVYCGDLLIIRWGDLTGVITDYDLEDRSASLEVCIFADSSGGDKNVEIGSKGFTFSENSHGDSELDSKVVSAGSKLVPGKLKEFVTKLSLVLPYMGDIILEQQEVRFKDDYSDRSNCYGIVCSSKFILSTSPVISFVTSDSETSRDLKISGIKEFPESYIAFGCNGIRKMDLRDVKSNEIQIDELDSIYDVIMKIVNRGTISLKYI